VRHAASSPALICFLTCCPSPPSLPLFILPCTPLLQAGAQLDCHMTVSGDNALISAVKGDFLECVEILISAGANLEGGTDNGSMAGEG